jgi:AAHS family 4-hydroxybenzoate transporter-like MFS transporter
MATAKVIDVQEFINSHRLSSVHVVLLVLCFLVVAIRRVRHCVDRLHRTRHQVRLEPHAGRARAAVRLRPVRPDGGRLCHRAADRHGRKAVLIFALLFFGLASLASSFSPNLTILIALRFVTGLGLGGAVPNAITLTSEYCPQRWKWRRGNRDELVHGYRIL